MEKHNYIQKRSFTTPRSNKNMQRKIILVFILFLKNNFLVSQINIGAEIRPRTEFRGGYKSPIESVKNMVILTDQRTRLSFGYKESDLELKITMQDVRIWGAIPMVGANGSSLGVTDAWLKYQFISNANVKIGRQEISLDNERIFGALNWAQAGRFHDAICLNLFKKDSLNLNYHLNVFGTINQNQNTLVKERFNVQGSYKSLLGVHYAWAIPSKLINGSLLGASVFYPTATTDTQSLTWNLNTYGATANVKMGMVFLGLEGYIQNRSITSKTDFLGAFSAHYKSGKLTSFIGVDWLSSNFNPMFGTNHKFYGFMDYYYVGNSHQNKGLFNPYIRFDFTGNKSQLSFRAHHFRTGEWKSILNNNSDMGEEIDLLWSRSIDKSLKFTLGWSIMRPTSLLKEIKRATPSSDIQTWGFLQLTYKPKFNEIKL